jgi:flagellin
MSTINTNVNSMIAQRVLGQQNQQLNSTLQKLSTGLRINRGKDDPAGLIASENLRSQNTAINAAIGNVERADSMMNVAEGGLKEVNSQLLELQSLVSKSANEAGLSDEEKQANQQEVDAILSSIDRIANTTNFQGKNLLNGNFDFETSNQSGAVDSLNIDRAKLNDDTLNVQANVLASAQRGGLFLSTGGSGLDLAGASDDSTVTFDIEVAGAKGSKEFSFTSGTTEAEMKNAINAYTDVTGVSATTSGGVRLDATEFGSDDFVSVNVTDAANINAGSGVYQLSATNTSEADDDNNTAFGSVTNAIKDTGQDIDMLINGSKADSSGREVSINTDNIAGTVTIGDGGTAFGAQNNGSGKLFDVTGGGAKFNIGANVGPRNSIEMTLGDAQVRNLGSADVDGTTRALDELGSGGELNLVDGDLSGAQKVVESAIKEVATLRGRIGSVQKNTLQPTANNLNVAMENTSAAESAIRDTDFAEATADLTRSQILQQSAQNSLSIANNQPQNVLSLLRG